MNVLHANTTRLDQYISEGRVIRGDWTGTDAQGRETACLLAALSPEVAEQQDAVACPATTLPAWFACLTPWIDDAGTIEHWPGVVNRYAALARRWHVLTDEQWSALEVDVKILCIEHALKYVTADKWGVRAACAQVITALRTGDERKIAAADAAADAARAATNAANAAANAANAARAAANAAADAAADAARAAAYAAARAATNAANAAARAADTLIDAAFDALEAVIVVGEGS
jgi:hypothetical protein